jgi:hypothetical protein
MTVSPLSQICHLPPFCNLTGQRRTFGASLTVNEDVKVKTARL